MGPGVVVLLRFPLTKQQVDDLGAWLRNNTTEPQGSQLQWEFQMDGSLFGISQDSTGGLHSFGLTDSEPQMGTSEMEKIVPEIGYAPRQELILYAMAKGSSDHHILGHLALSIAERYDAMIDMGGAISWKRKQDWEPRLKAISGKVIEVVETPASGNGCHHVVDRIFMSGWLKDPAFHLIN